MAWRSSLLRYDRSCRAFFADIEQRGGNVNSLRPNRILIRFETLTVTNADLEKLATMRNDIVFVDFVGTNINDSHVSALAQLENLDCLGLGGTRISATGLSRLEDALPKCKINVDRSRLAATSE